MSGTKRLALGGILDAASSMRMVGMVKKMPLQFVDDVEFGLGGLNDDEEEEVERVTDVNCDPLSAEPRSDCRQVKSNKKRVRSSTTTTTTRSPPVVKATTTSCCKQHMPDLDSPMSDVDVRRETARLNLDVLRRLSDMLGEEREKLTAERRMMTATRDRMLTEIRKVNSERGKIDSERRKVELERDMLQSQMLGRSYQAQLPYPYLP